MFIRYILPLLAVLGLGFAVFTVVQGQQTPPPSRPIVPPPQQPEFRSIAGAGIIEARRENIPIGTQVPGVVWEVNVKVGERVKKDEPLFRLDDRSARAELDAAQGPARLGRGGAEAT